MAKTRLVLIGVTAAIAAVGAASAQQPDNGKRRPPRQTHDKGFDEVVPAGQESRIGERSLAGVRIVAGPNGSVIAHLDETFHDALVAIRKADGSIGYTCLHGLSAADHHLETQVPAKAAKPVPAAPVLEEQ